MRQKYELITFGLCLVVTDEIMLHEKSIYEITFKGGLHNFVFSLPFLPFFSVGDIDA